MGLTGPTGVLPYAYTELILERLRSKDNSLASFLDIFNHRMISFFYRAWEKYRFPVTYALGEEDLFTHHLLDLVGLGTPGLRGTAGGGRRGPVALRRAAGDANALGDGAGGDSQRLFRGAG